MKDNMIKLLMTMIIGLSFIIGCWILSKSVENIDVSEEDTQEIGLNEEKALMSETEAANYLNIPLDDLKRMVVKSEAIRTQRGSYDTFEYVPFMIIEGKKYFDRLQLDKWIEYNMLHGRGTDLYSLYR